MPHGCYAFAGRWVGTDGAVHTEGMALATDGVPRTPLLLARLGAGTPPRAGQGAEHGDQHDQDDQDGTVKHAQRFRRLG